MELAYTGLSGGYKSCLQLTAIVLSSSATCRYDLGGGGAIQKNYGVHLLFIKRLKCMCQKKRELFQTVTYF